MTNCLCEMVDQKKCVKAYFQPCTLSEIFTIAKLPQLGLGTIM